MDKDKTHDTTTPLYPEPTRGQLSNDHSTYGKSAPKAGRDPDKYMGLYYAIGMIIIGVLFWLAIKSFAGFSL